MTAAPTMTFDWQFRPVPIVKPRSTLAWPDATETAWATAAVPVELELYRGLTHDFIKMGRALKEAGHAQRVAGEALRRAWNP